MLRTSPESTSRASGFPFSPARRLMWHFDQLATPSGRGHASVVVRVRRHADPAAVRAALLAAAKQLDMAGAVALHDGEPVAMPGDGRLVDFAHTERGEASLEDVVSQAVADAAIPFDLGNGPLLRARWYRRGPADHVLLLAAASVAADVPMLRHLLTGRVSREQSGEPDSGDTLASWRGRLAGADTTLDWHAERDPASLRSEPHRIRQTQLDATVTWQLGRLAPDRRATPTVVVAAVLRILLHRHTGQHDVLLGLRADDGPTEAAVTATGAVVTHGDMLLLRNDLGDEPSFRAAVARESAARVEAQTGRVGFADLAAALPTAWERGAFPLTQAVIVEEPADWKVLSTPADLLRASDPLPVDVAVRVAADGDGLRLTWSWGPAVAAEDRLVERFLTLLRDALAWPDRSVAELSALTDDDRRLLASGAAGPIDSPGAIHSAAAGARTEAGTVLAELVAVWSRRTPEAVAARHGEQIRTYADLERDSGRVAARLAALALPAETRVAVLADRNADLPAVLLGVARAGHACVPLDPSHPAERLRYVIEDAGVQVVLTDQEQLVAAVDDTIQSLRVVELIADAAPPAAPQLPLPHPDQLAYVLYTSGSTGRPKGVAVTHRGLANCVAATRDLMGCRPGQRLLAITTISFDIAMLELFLMLVSGGQTIVAAAHEAKDGEALRAALRRWRPDVMQATPLTWQMLLQSGWEGDPDLTISCGGDVVSPALAARLRACSQGFWHTYGPTETTLYTTCVPLRPGPQPRPLPIGVPLPGTWARVLDERLRVVPPGVVGELCVGGVGVARGYLGRPGLTAARFVPDPEAPGQRLYRTGDLARLRMDGGFELHGRNDRQVKIRGHRIEPEEIESVLATHPDVASAAVTIDENGGGRRILAFLQLSPQASPQAANAVASYVRQRLPHHMTPASYAVLERMPVSANGKLDRRALAALRPPTATLRREERDELAATIERIWQGVLGDDVGADFFARGIVPRQAAAATAWANGVCGVDLPLSALHQAPTALAYAGRVRRARLAGQRGVDTRDESLITWLRGEGRLPPAVLLTAHPHHRFVAALEPDRPVGMVVAPDLALRRLGQCCAELAAAAGSADPILVAGPDGLGLALAVAGRLRRDARMTTPVVAVAPGVAPEGLSGSTGPVCYVHGGDDALAEGWRSAGGRVDLLVVRTGGAHGPAAALLDGGAADRLAGIVSAIVSASP